MGTMGIILAGGKSTRMGIDKANLNWQGQTLLEFQIKNLSTVVGIQNVYVSGNRPGFNSIPDQILGRGPIEGIKTILTNFKCVDQYSKVFVIPVDMPFISPSHFFSLEQKIENFDAIKFRNFQFPVLLQNLSKVRSILSEMEMDLVKTKIEANYSNSSLYKKLSVLEVTANYDEEFINTNTPEEWENAISKTSHIT